MPVTAKLSRRFYDRFGDELTNELVEWLNAVDAAYRSDLREINELNFARFDAKVGQRFAESSATMERRLMELEANWERRFSELDRRFAEFEANVDSRFAEFKAYVDRRFAESEANVDRRFAEFDATMERRFGEFDVKLAVAERRIIAWMFAFWTATIIPLGGLVYTILHTR